MVTDPPPLVTMSAKISVIIMIIFVGFFKISNQIHGPVALYLPYIEKAYS